MRVSVGDCRLFVDVEGLGPVPEGPGGGLPAIRAFLAG